MQNSSFTASLFGVKALGINSVGKHSEIESRFTLISIESTSEQWYWSVAVTKYVEVTLGVATGLKHCVQLNPRAGDHSKDKEKEVEKAVKPILSPNLTSAASGSIA